MVYSPYATLVSLPYVATLYRSYIDVATLSSQGDNG